MIDFGANFSLSGVPDILVTLALLYIGAVVLARGLGRISIPQVHAKFGGAVFNPAIQTAWALIRLAPGIIMGIAGLALIASTLPAALRMIGL
jgi:hypothetical protein